MQLSYDRNSSKMFQFAKKSAEEEVIFYLHYYYRGASRGIFTFLQFQPQEFTLLQDCMIKMNFSVYTTKDYHFNWPLSVLFVVKFLYKYDEELTREFRSRRVFIRNAINHLERCYARSFRLIITFCFFLPNHQFSRFPIRIREQHSIFTIFLSKIQI